MSGYDEKCGDLAKYFLPEEQEDVVRDLAQVIQDAVENWIVGNAERLYSHPRHEQAN